MPTRVFGTTSIGRHFSKLDHCPETGSMEGAIGPYKRVVKPLKLRTCLLVALIYNIFTYISRTVLLAD